jgi:hypothetical protein
MDQVTVAVLADRIEQALSVSDVARCREQISAFDRVLSLRALHICRRRNLQRLNRARRDAVATGIPVATTSFATRESDLATLRLELDNPRPR